MFKKLKSLFVVEDESSPKTPVEGDLTEELDDNSKESPETNGGQMQNPTSNTNIGTESMPSNEAAPEGQITNKFMEVLLGALDKNNLEGFDYLEYKQSLRELSKMDNMDEQTRYQSAYAMAKTMGATPKKLVDTATHYLNILKKEEQKFQQALAGQRSKQIGDKENSLKQGASLIAEKQKRIKELEQEIVSTQKQMDQMKAEISNASVKVETTKNNFMATFNVIVSQIQDDVSKMKQYLK